MAAAAAAEEAAAATAEEAATVDSALCIVYSPMTARSASYKTCVQCDAHMFSDLLRVRLPKERRCTGIIMPPTTNVCRTPAQAQLLSQPPLPPCLSHDDMALPRTYTNNWFVHPTLRATASIHAQQLTSLLPAVQRQRRCVLRRSAPALPVAFLVVHMAAYWIFCCA